MSTSIKEQKTAKHTIVFNRFRYLFYNITLYKLANPRLRALCPISSDVCSLML